MKIAHISDFHARRHVPGHPRLMKRRARAVLDLLATAVEEVRGHAPDALAVTGDLVDAPFYGFSDDDTIDRVEADLRLIREIIDPVGCPVFYLFGNHDHPAAFRKVFPDASTDTAVAGHRVVSFYDEEAEDHVPERMDDERDRFLAVLGDDDPTPQVHLQHYLVWPEHNEGYPHSYRDAADLKTRVVDSGRVALCLSGHYHVGVDAFQEGATWFATARAFCEPPHPYRIYTLQAGEVEQTEHTVASSAPSRAVFLDAELLDAIVDRPDTLAALTALSAQDWALIAVADRGDREMQAFEVENDERSARLAEAGLDLDAVAWRTTEIPGEPYAAAESDLGIDLSASRAVVGGETEGTAARGAGITTATARPGRVIPALERIVSA